MNIYAAEASVDGLADKILASQSVTYSSQLTPWTQEERGLLQERLKDNLQSLAKHFGKTKASTFDSDLFFTRSILVSTNWNKNDDVFAPEPVWTARHTPTHKRTNLEHDENRLVGHITETWAIDVDGDLIPDNTTIDDLPDLFHIANGAVIYTNWKDEKLEARTHELIQQIEAGEKFVSMEALFSNFDYAIVTPEKEYHVVARNKETAFLTKHLRIYGGSGEYEGCSVGRLLKNITFCGKGYVNKPANPYSIIFNSNNKFDFSSASLENPFSRQSGVLISYSSNTDNTKENTENLSMADTNTLSVDLLKQQNEEYKGELKTLQAKVEELTKANTEAGVKSLEDKVSELEGKLEASAKDLAEAKETIESLSTKEKELSTKLTEANEAKAELEKKIEEAEAAQAKADRISKLVDGGIEKAKAEEKVEVFAELSDAQFEVVAQSLIEATKAASDMKDKEKDKKDEKDKERAAKAGETPDVDEDEAEENADASALDETEEDEEADLAADASDESEEDKLKATREELQAAIANFTNFGSKSEDSE